MVEQGAGATRQGIYVTGTDTGVGKTLASCALLHALRAGGARTVGMKPLASGCKEIDGRWRNDDALALQLASERRPDYADVNPFALPLPLAPELAAREAGVEVSLGPVLDAFARLRADADTVVVEGVGGWAAPLGPSLWQSDLVRCLQLDVVLVVGLRLGCLNHAILSARAIAADGCRLVGWIASDIDPGMERADANFDLLAHRLAVPCWGRFPHRDPADPTELARCLRPGGGPLAMAAGARSGG